MATVHDVQQSPRRRGHQLPAVAAVGHLEFPVGLLIVYWWLMVHNGGLFGGSTTNNDGSSGDQYNPRGGSNGWSYISVTQLMTSDSLVSGGGAY